MAQGIMFKALDGRVVGPFPEGIAQSYRNKGWSELGVEDIDIPLGEVRDVPEPEAPAEDAYDPAKCVAITSAGTQCKNDALGDTQLCGTHAVAEDNEDEE